MAQSDPMWFSAPLPPLLLASSLATVFGAGIVRGVAGLALPVSPTKVVPAIFVLEMLASISVLRAVVELFGSGPEPIPA